MFRITNFRLLAFSVGFLLGCNTLAVLAEEQATPDEFPEGYVAEAPLPQDFPIPSEPGKVIEKTYPVVRSYSATGTGAFMKCFAYLSANQYKMTAPVVMDLQPAAEADKAASIDGMPAPVARMHFLLEQNSLDKPQQVGEVQVADIPPLRVLSIAFHGETTAEKIKEGQSALEARLAEMPSVARAGEYRVLGYNNPMIKRAKNLWELQLPIAEKSKSKYHH
ncbi:MAG: heme-binding protein [Bythopirellula sp.]|nr:heme-binding protein [Bythopirellula sp.]